MGLHIARKALQSFDWWGEPVAPLNMRGQTVYTTSFAGLVGLAITISMLLFTKSKAEKMINAATKILDVGQDLIQTRGYSAMRFQDIAG